MSIVTKKNGPKKGAQTPTVYSWQRVALSGPVEVYYSITPPGEYGPALANPRCGTPGRPSYDVLTRVRVPVRTSMVVPRPSNDILRALARAHAGL